jgi:hypothetical protein
MIKNETVVIINPKKNESQTARVISTIIKKIIPILFIIPIILKSLEVEQNNP